MSKSWVFVFPANFENYKTTSTAEFSRKLDKDGSINKCEAQQILGSDKQTLTKKEYQLILSEVLKSQISFLGKI